MPAKFTHYVSLFNNGIYPAQSGAAEGYEDEHLTEWRPANQNEIEKYLRGDVDVPVQAISLSAPVQAAVQPSTIQLAEEDEPVTVVPQPTVVAEAPVVAAPVAPQPVSPAPVMPAPVLPPIA
jgi:hypothetical protein